MTRPIVKFHNLDTDEIIEREMTDQEFAEYQANKAAIANEATTKLAKAAEKTALLAKLGITDEEAKLLLS